MWSPASPGDTVVAGPHSQGEHVDPAPTRYRNLLSVTPLGKAIPYAGSDEARPDGGVNHGFTDIKGHPERLDEVPESRDDPSLAHLMRTIGAPDTGVFSIASMSEVESSDRGVQRSGYLEVAFNSRQRVESAADYFDLFLRFERLLAARAFAHAVRFEWELCPAHFSAGDIGGYSVAIRIRTSCEADHCRASESWQAAMAVLAELFGAVPEERSDPMYGPRAS